MKTAIILDCEFLCREDSQRGFGVEPMTRTRSSRRLALSS